MKNLLVTTTALVTYATTAVAGEFKATNVYTHPTQGEVIVVENAISTLSVSETGVFASLETQGLEPGSAYKPWFITIANPSACSASPCSGKDVLTDSDEIMADVTLADGLVADEAGFGQFVTHQDYGQLKDGWFGNGFADAEASEIHLVLKEHGPLIEGRAAQMIGTFRDACTNESISKAFPAIALADGDSGPNTCAMIQFSVFDASRTNS